MHLTFSDFIIQIVKMRTFLVAIVITLVVANALAYSVPDEIDMENDLEQLDSDAYQERDPEDQQENDPEDFKGRSQNTGNYGGLQLIEAHLYHSISQLRISNSFSWWFRTGAAPESFR